MPLPALQSAVDSGAVSGGVVLLADRSAVLSVEAAGLRDVAAAAPTCDDTLFWVASMSKPLTATAAMLLVEQGDLDLDRPVEAYLEDFRGRRPQGLITVRQALSHSSGLPFASPAELEHPGGVERFAGSRFAHYRETGDDAVYDSMPSLAAAATTYATTPLVSAPGGTLYSNAGINLVGRVVEVASGVPYETFVRQRLLEPLGMVDTTLYPTAAQLARLAKSYDAVSLLPSLGPALRGLHGLPDRRVLAWQEDEFLEAVPFPQLTAPYNDRSRGVSPSVRTASPEATRLQLTGSLLQGGFFSTAADFGRFGRMILRGGELDGVRYLSEAAVAEMTGPAPRNEGCELPPSALSLRLICYR